MGENSSTFDAVPGSSSLNCLPAVGAVRFPCSLSVTPLLTRISRRGFCSLQPQMLFPGAQPDPCGRSATEQESLPT